MATNCPENWQCPPCKSHAEKHTESMHGGNPFPPLASHNPAGIFTGQCTSLQVIYITICHFLRVCGQSIIQVACCAGMAPLEAKTSKSWITSVCRWGFSLALALSIPYTTRLDYSVQQAWDHIRKMNIVKHDSFEPGLVMACFAIYMFAFYALDTYFPACKKWRIQKHSDDMRHWTYEGARYAVNTILSGKSGFKLVDLQTHTFLLRMLFCMSIYVPGVVR